MNYQITLTLFEFISVLIFMVVLFLVYKELAPELTFKINKPHKWQQALKNGEISGNLVRLEKKYPDKVRFYNFWLQVERLKTDKIPGNFAELGVFQGETARILYEMDPSRTLRLFDTFTGFEKADLQAETQEDAKYNPKRFSDTNLEKVKEYINGKENVLFYPGYFPETSRGLENTAYAFVHLDADLYNPTLAALKFFYPRLSPGGVIIIHDYNHNWGSLRKAVEEFIASIEESIVEVADWQGSAMIIKNAR